METSQKLRVIDYSVIRLALDQASRDEESLSCEDNYSRYIYKGVAFLRALGLTVEQFAFDLPDNVVGQISYRDKTVKINNPSAQSALMTVAHETGHWISYLRYGGREDTTCKEREHWAYLYGWVVLKWLGARELISKNQWREHHHDREIGPGSLGWDH